MRVEGGKLEEEEEEGDYGMKIKVIMSMMKSTK